MGTLQLSAIEEECSRLPSWSVLPPWLLPRLMPTPGTAPTATPTGATPTGDTTAMEQQLGLLEQTRHAGDTGTTTARGPLTPSPRLRLTLGTNPTATPTGTCTPTGTDPATPSTGPSTTRGPLMPSPRLRLRL